MIYVYRSKPSTGARDLAAALDGRRIRQKVNIDSLTRPGDTVVCWGEAWSKPGVIVLNGGPFKTKLQDIEVLTAAGIRTVEASRNRPTTGGTVPPDPFLLRINDTKDIVSDLLEVNWDRSPIFGESLGRVIRDLQALQTTGRTPAPTVGPAIPDPNWVGRSNHHVGGLDLLTPPTSPDYWVKKETITEEYRLHIFDSKSIRAGKKAPRTGLTTPASPWIRSFDGGWKIVYDRYESTREQRELASAAVQALGLTFGAVDLGLLAGGGLLVLEVNRAPGLEGGTVEAYGRAIEGWEERQERRAA